MGPGGASRPGLWYPDLMETHSKQAFDTGDFVRVSTKRPALRIEGTGVVVEAIRASGVPNKSPISMYFTVLIEGQLCTVWPSEISHL